ncbi:MAG: DUF2065 domain-containing protein [Thiotrichaceae bacterium]|nr:DUF2065 domain-containing protein [Thiotrichaceae bacterium]
MELNWTDLINALALFLIFEGLLPFASPQGLKKAYHSILSMSENSIRIMGLSSILIGLFVLFLN